MTLQLVSFGGGVQSTALMVLAVQGQIPHENFVFANVGERAEHPDTLAYMKNHTRPFAEAHGLNLAELPWVARNGVERDLYDDLVKPGAKDVPIPVRMTTGGLGNRKCTQRYKIEVVNRWARKHGASIKNPCMMAVGISTDEIERARTHGLDPRYPMRSIEYPLLDLGLSRADCHQIVAGAGMPPPPKSSCWFCPLQSTESWRHMHDARPDLWEAAVTLESRINANRTELGRDSVFLHHRGPLEEAITNDQLLLPGFDCFSGQCGL